MLLSVCVSKVLLGIVLRGALQRHPGENTRHSVRRAGCTRTALTLASSVNLHDDPRLCDEHVLHLQHPPEIVRAALTLAQLELEINRGVGARVVCFAC